MNAKKTEKRIAHAKMVWEREQIKAAMIAEQLDKAIAAVEQYKEELTEEQIKSVYEQIDIRKKDLEEFVLKCRNKFITKLSELGIEVPLTQSANSNSATVKEL